MGAENFIHMDTDLVEPVMRGLSGAGEELDGGWRACRAQVESGAAGIGADVLGQAFRGAYESAGAELLAAADELPPRLRAAAEAGMACCADYVDSDVRAASAMPGPAGRGL